MKVRMQIKGRLTLEVLDENRVLVRKVEVNNMIMAVILAEIAKMIRTGSGTISVTHLAIGTGTTVETPVDTTLKHESKREVIVKTAPTATKIECVATWPVGAATGTYTEAGMFSAASGGTMFNRTTFAPLLVKAQNQLIATWVLEVI